MLNFDILVVGAGVSGLTAASSASESGCESVLVVDAGDEAGGILRQCFHDGFDNGLTGPQYAQKILKRFRNTKAELMLETRVLSVSENREAVLSCRSGLFKVVFKRLIFANGCTEKQIVIPGARPAKGIWSAGQAQNMLNLMNREIGEKIAVLGSGDLGMIMAGTLAERGKTVTVIEKQNSYGGMPRNYRKYIEANSVPVIYNAGIEEIRGNERITGVLLSNGESLGCDALLVAIGLEPDRTLDEELGERDWVYHCGNCNRVHSMVESAVAEAEQTGKKAAKGLI